MKILLIGAGGREHSLAIALSKSKKLSELYIAPGNPGTAQYGTNIDISDTNLPQLLQFAQNKKIDLTIVGPETPLVLGIVDLFEAHTLKIIGPDKQAARLEGSKVWAKSFMERHQIPTATYKTFTDYATARLYIEKETFPLVIKADGLAAGKGVTVAYTFEDADAALTDCFIKNKFGKSGAQIVIESFLEGEEASVLAFTDGNTIVPLLAAQDHKAVYDNDKGPNTGGMGAYCPAPIITEERLNTIQKQVLEPVMHGMKAEGMAYQGILYAGLMITKNGPYVIEYNVRFGDPETQAVLPMLDTDLLDIFIAISEKRLHNCPITWQKGACVCVVIASGGYPEAFEKGHTISGIDAAQKTGVQVIHAGTQIDSYGNLLSNGGRVLGIVAQNTTLEKTIQQVYAGASKIQFTNHHYRKDIAQKALRSF